MNKNQWMKLVNPLLGVAFLILAGSGLVLFFNLFPFQDEFFAKMHAFTGLVFIALALVHLLLNGGWVKANFFKKR